MSCVPDFVDLLWQLGVLVLSGGILYRTMQVDGELRECHQKRLWGVWFAACIVAEAGFLVCMQGAEPVPKVCLLVLAVYFVVCSTMDSMLCMVNNFMQYIGAAGGGILVLHQLPRKEIGISLLAFALVQYVLFRKMYGSADVMAFLICALYLAGRNKNIEDYLLHMTVCYLLLAVVQGARGNITEKGQLEKPVALYPYISASFLLIIYQ